MKKFMAIVLAGVMLVSLASCGKTDPTRNPDDYTKKTEETTEESKTPADTTEESKGGEPAATTATVDRISLQAGELYIVGDTPVVKAVCVAGNRSGSLEFNYRKPSTEGIRCIFELNEYLDFVLETDGTAGIKVYAFKQQQDASVYLEKDFDNDESMVASADLSKPESEGDGWGSFYLNPEDCTEGIYDIVFVKDGKAVAIMAAKFVGAGVLEGMTDEQIASAMERF